MLMKNRSVVEAEEELNIASEKGIVEDGEEDENAVAGEVDDGEEVGDEEEVEMKKRKLKMKKRKSKMKRRRRKTTTKRTMKMMKKID